MDATLIHLSLIGEIEAIKNLIVEGVDINFKDGDENTAIHKAAEGNCVEVLNLLLENGADINAGNKDGNTALHVATLFNSLECVKLLLNNNIDVNVFNNEEKSALMYAMDPSREPQNATERNTRDKIIELLVKNENMDLQCTSSRARRIFNGFNYLFKAIQSGNLFVVEKIIEKDPSLLEVRSKHGNYPIQAAAYSNRLEILKFILSTNGGLLNVRGTLSYTPLYYAVDHMFFDIITYLVEQKADANIQNVYGNTPLHESISCYMKCCKEGNKAVCKPEDRYAVSYGKFQDYLVDLKSKCFNLAIAAFLIQCGKADIYIRNEEGKTPLDLIESEQHVVAFLKKINEKANNSNVD